MADNTPQDTMFIDMKYIILYRKLGFKEMKPDVFKKRYDNFEIIIESENQSFLFDNTWYDLKTYEDMVLIECLNRLLLKGYTKKEIMITRSKDLKLYQDNKLFCTIKMADWGISFNEKVNAYNHTCSTDTIIYASRLKGGLIEFRQMAFVRKQIFNSGLLDYDIAKFKPDYRNIDQDNYVKLDGFIMSNTRLAEYTGNDKEVIIPKGIKRVC